MQRPTLLCSFGPARRQLGLILWALLSLAACDGNGTWTPSPATPVQAATARDALAAGWQLTGSLSQSRLEHSATLLGSGKVLVAGGYNHRAELYDTTVGTWSTTANSLAVHHGHTATLLNSGKVLLAGGEQCQSSTSAEVYDDTSAQWSRTGSLLTCRGHHAAVPLASGQVLVEGGLTNSGTPLASAELYDPTTGTWSATGSLATARADFTATLLPSGKVLVTGGTSSSSGALLASAELYNPTTGTWSATAPLSTARGFHTATLLPSGLVLVVGGAGAHGPLSASAELYNPATGTWTATGSLAQPRRYHSATLLPSGQVLVAGGYHGSTGIQYGAELYDSATGTWSATAPLNVDRYGHTATLLPSGQVLVAGGISNHDSASAERYIPASAPPPAPREPHPTPIDPNRFTPLAEATEFLYSGPNAIQVGVRPGTIAPQRVAVLRGVVKTRGETTLEGVRVSILGHPEYGYTLTRANGAFDLAVNGGGALTVQYELQGYLPAQRQVKAGWVSYAWLPEVLLIAVDAQVTPVTLNGSATGFQAAQGSASKDADGTRQATVLFPPDTTASLVLPDGSLQPLSTLHVRATEYTVGAQGPQTMPGELPPASGYTYAVELSADEALAANAREVRFSKPVYLYVDNFLGFPVGEAVPSGWYDRQAGVWRPSADGRVLKVLDVTGGLASLDVTGDGVADTGGALSALGLTDAERQRLATLFAPGKSFWRAPIPHFTPWDLNWPFDFPWDAIVPNLSLEMQEDEKDSDIHCGSIIDCQNQVLGESEGVVGTPYQLSYRSNRVPSFRAAQPIKVPLTGATIPASAEAVLMEVQVAGQYKLFTFPAEPHQSTTFQWDGKDGYGRPVQGVFPLTIRIGYSYQLVSMMAAGSGSGSGSGGPSFARFGIADISSDRARRTGALWQTIEKTVGSWIVPTTQLGGWTLDVHHAYDPASQVLYLGHGEQRAIGLTASTPLLTTVAGDGDFGSIGDGAGAKQARLWNPHDVAVAPDGTLYIADTFNNRVRKVGTDGILTTLPGSEAYQPRSVAVGPDGGVYVAYTALHCIRKVLPDGSAITVAGTCGFSSNGDSGDEGPATHARLSYPHGLAVGKEGNLYIADFDNDRVRYVTPEGIIHPLAGKPNGRGFCGDNGLAAEACLNGPWDVAVSADGEVYVSDSANHRVRRIGTNGRITTVVGTGTDGWTGTQIGDGGPAKQAQLSSPRGLALDAAGNLYIADQPSRVRRVDTHGTITTFAGQVQTSGFSGQGTPALQGLLDSPAGLAVSPDGALHVSDEWNHSVRRVGYPGTLLRENEAWVASTDATELYVFTAKEGRHLRTVDARTQVVRYAFGYDSEGRLTSIQDVNGLITRVERDSTTGRPRALVAPHGQRTALEVDAQGYLSAIVNPANERVELTHSSEGLLTQLKDARNNVHTYEYTSEGRLKKDSNPADGSKTLVRTPLPDGYKVSVDTAMGRRTTYQVQNLSVGGQQRTTTVSSGEVFTRQLGADGTAITTDPDGTVTTSVEGPDPRLGMQSPYTTMQSIRLPSGLTRTVNSNRAATLLTAGDIFSLASLSGTVTVNGRTSVSTYDAATSTLTATSPSGRQSTTLLDAKGRTVRREIPGLLPVQYAYGAEGQVERVTHGTRTLAFTYNSQGELAGQTDALARTSSMTYDPAGRVMTQLLPGSRAVGFGYDVSGNLTSLTPPGQPVHSFAHTSADQESVYTPPALPGVPTVTTSSSYNLDGQPLSKRYPDGTALSFTYEDTSSSKKGSLQTVTMSPPPGSGQDAITRQLSYHPVSGKLQSLTDSRGSSISYLYDGPLTTKATWTGAVQGHVEYGHDSFFRVSSLAVNDAPAISYGYDDDGLLIQAGSLSLARNVDNGLLERTTLGRVATSVDHNGYGEADGSTAFYDTSSLFSWHLGRDASGRILEKQETIQGVSHTYAYAYDDAGRLVNVLEDGVPISSSVYDAGAPGNGNRTSHTQGGITRTATYDAQDRLLSFGGAVYSYGANGDLRSKQVGSQLTAYVYDAWGNLLSSTLPDGTRVEYIVDAHNRRVGKKVNGTLVQGFLYDGQLRVIAELDGNNQVVTRFVYASQAHVPDYMMKARATYRILTDPLGSPRLIVDVDTGAIAQRLDYDPWGVVLADTRPGFQPFGFAGGLYDRHTGLTRFGARDYDAETGRWTAKDPIRFAGGDTNLYAYVGGNPIMFVDPSGLASWYASDLFFKPVFFPVFGTGHLMYLHYSRNSANRTPPRDVARKQGWTSTGHYYHRWGDCDNDKNEKFVSPNGGHCEAVYDKNGQVVTDPLNMGTYNYGDQSAGFWGNAEHLALDVVPYYILGNTPGDLLQPPVTGIVRRIIGPWWTRVQ
ncbi:kelch repeat-containing protein [Cystobacter fuscus]|uniref:NHL domain-containing protein n=1 Tax=Cystobacter fuscus TaxID=43 RepID=UPI002B2F2E4B|nr:hypothetical protein F0U63_33425 [Cystobacter fuscus]